MEPVEPIDTAKSFKALIQEVTIIRNNRTWQYTIENRKGPIKVEIRWTPAGQTVQGQDCYSLKKPNGCLNEFPCQMELDDITYYADQCFERQPSTTYTNYCGFYIIERTD